MYNHLYILTVHVGISHTIIHPNLTFYTNHQPPLTQPHFTFTSYILKHLIKSSFHSILLSYQHLITKTLRYSNTMASLSSQSTNTPASTTILPPLTGVTDYPNLRYALDEILQSNFGITGQDILNKTSTTLINPGPTPAYNDERRHPITGLPIPGSREYTQEALTNAQTALGTAFDTNLQTNLDGYWQTAWSCLAYLSVLFSPTISSLSTGNGNLLYLSHPHQHSTSLLSNRIQL